MRTFELDALVRRESETHRLYPWRDVERMRERLATVSMGASAACHNARNLETLRRAVNDLREALRTKGDYEAADALRAVLKETEPYG